MAITFSSNFLKELTPEKVGQRAQEAVKFLLKTPEAPAPKPTPKKKEKVNISGSIDKLIGARIEPVISALSKGQFKQATKELQTNTKLSSERLNKQLAAALEGDSEALTDLALSFSPISSVAKEKKIIVDPVKDYLKKKVSTVVEEIKVPLKEKFYSSFNKIYTSVIDRFNPIVNITKQVEKNVSIPPGLNPELLSRRYLAIKGITESKLYWKTTKLDNAGNLVETGPGLAPILKPVRDNLNDLRALMVAERDIELAAREIKGVTPIESRNIIDHLSNKYGSQFKVLGNTFKAVRDYTRKTVLEPLRDSGFISQKTFDTITQSNQFYTPYKRVMDVLENQGYIPKNKNIFQPKSSGLKPIKGSERKIIDPLESIIADTYRVTDLVERHNVARSVVNLRNFSDELADLIKPVKPKMIPVAKTGEETIFRPSHLLGKNQIMVFENGIRKIYEVSEELGKAMNGMGAGDVNVVFKIMSLPARTLRAGATLTPEFSFRNPIRDQMTAFIQSKYGYRPGIDMVEGFWNLMGKTDTYQRWLASGGGQAELVALDRIATQKKLAEISTKNLGISPEQALIQLKKLAREPLAPLRAISQFGEQGTRIGAFRRAKLKGASDLEAAFESRELTLDFSRIGTATKEVNKIVAFFNANVQGLDKLARTFKERPVSASFKAIMGLTVPSIGLYLMNKDNPRYQELPQWQKDLFWIVIPQKDKGPIFRIPKPFTLGAVFATMPEHLMQWIDKNDPEALTTIPEAISKGAAPGTIPTFLLPILENQANYSFFRDRPIVSEGLQDLPPELQSSTYTTETAKEIGKLIKKSPNKIENLIQGYFGGLGRYALQTSDEILKGIGVVNPPPAPAKGVEDIPGLKGFIAREPIGSNSESVNKLYDIYEKSQQSEAAAKKLANEGDIEGSTKYMEDHKEALFAKELRRVTKDLANLRKQKELIFNAQDIDPKRKKQGIAEIDTLMTEYARQVLTLIESAK